MTKFLNLAFLFISLFFVSCEGVTEIELYIQNDTASTIQVEGSFNDDYYEPGTTFNFIIKEGQKQKIHDRESQGGSSKKIDIPFHLIETLTITDDVGNNIPLDYLSDSNIQHHIEEVTKTPSKYEQSYYLIVK